MYSNPGPTDHGHEHQDPTAQVHGHQVDEVRARWVGHRLQADVRMTFDRDLDVATAHDIAEEGRRAMLDAFPLLDPPVIHVDPCGHDGSGPHDPHPAEAHAHG